jgi:hypothetical protein
MVNCGPWPRYETVKTHTGDCELCGLLGVDVVVMVVDGIQETVCLANGCADAIKTAPPAPPENRIEHSIGGEVTVAQMVVGICFMLAIAGVSLLVVFANQ